MGLRWTHVLSLSGCELRAISLLSPQRTERVPDVVCTLPRGPDVGYGKALRDSNGLLLDLCANAHPSLLLVDTSVSPSRARASKSSRSP